MKEAASIYGVKPTCEALGFSRATYYRRQNPPSRIPRPRRNAPHPRSLSAQEQERILQVLNSRRFMDQSVPEVQTTLLDEGCYLCSQRTMYRILAKSQAVKERRNLSRHPNYTRPELLATGPNQVWSWDITRLKGPQKWEQYYLYVILDIFSRYVVGWLVAEGESAELARQLIQEACQRQNISKDQLTLHSDRGNAMRSYDVAQLLATLGVMRTHSRPYTSNDNPFSEAQFKTLKYHPLFPERFGSLEEARSLLRDFFHWYNHQHRHSGIGLMAPVIVHTGQSSLIRERRRQVLQQAFSRHPIRFVKGCPRPAPAPSAVWINKPEASISR